MMRFRRIEKDMGGMANVGLDQQHMQGKEDDVSTAESKTYIGSGTKTKVDMNKIKNTKIGDDIHYYVNGIEGRGIVVKMGSQYLDLFQQDGNVKTVNINDTFFVKDILVNKQWDNMDETERYEALQKIHAPTPRFIVKSWSALPDDIKNLLRKDGGLSGGSGSTYEAGETKDSETQDHARTGFAQNTQYDSSVKEKASKEADDAKQALESEIEKITGKKMPSGGKTIDEHIQSGIEGESDAVPLAGKEASLFKGDTGTVYKSWLESFVTKPEALPKGSKGSETNLHEDVTSDEEEARQMLTPNQFKTWEKERETWAEDADRKEEIQDIDELRKKPGMKKRRGKLTREQAKVEAQRSATGNQPTQSKKAGCYMLEDHQFNQDGVCVKCGKKHKKGVVEGFSKKAELEALFKGEYRLMKDSVDGQQSKEGKPDTSEYAKYACHICGKPGGHDDEDFYHDEITSRGKKTGKKITGTSRGTYYETDPEITEMLRDGTLREKSDVEQGKYSNPGSTPEVGVSTDTKVDVPASTGYEERPHISVEEAGKLPRATFNPHGNNELHVRGSQDSKDQPKFNQPVSQNQPVRKVGVPDQHPNYGVRYGMKGGVKKVWCPEHQVWEETTKDWHD